MPNNLPYPGFSWSLTQHMGRATAVTTYELLQAAYVYSGQADFRQLIAQYLGEQNLLTANVRTDSGQADAWRDYQQLLSEFGLILSSRFTDSNIINVSPIGLMWLDGMIGYSEFITTQCLKYQYPNGIKLDIQNNLHLQLVNNNIPAPSNRAQLDTIFKVRIKPAVLILRIFLALYDSGDFSPTLTVEECVEALVPTPNNGEWQQALFRLRALRQNSSNIPVDARIKRHVQEWFSFLGYTDIFKVVNNTRDVISFSQTAIENIPRLRELCDYHEQESSFWIPTSDNRKEIALSWFEYYGTPNVFEQWFIPEATDAYIQENYPEGVEDQEPEIIDKALEINLQGFLPKTPNFQSLPQIKVERIALGHERLRQSTRLHEEIVAMLATKLMQAGFQLSEDPNSVDLLASKENSETILEVKTVTQKNLYTRMRLGVGQLSEYRYRRQEQVNSRPAGVLVLSSEAQFPKWLLRYFENDINLGLVTLSRAREFARYTDGIVERIITD